MSLRNALLALLRVGPLSGYDLQKQFSVSVGHVWHAPDSQIYPELRKMEQAGLVVAEEQARGERGTRRVYSITPAGEQSFRDWFASPPDYLRVRDPAHLRAAYLEAATPDQARAFLHAHIDQWSAELVTFQEQLRLIENGESPTLIRRLAATPEALHPQTIAYKGFAYRGLIDRARSEIEWAKAGLALVDELEPGEVTE